MMYRVSFEAGKNLLIEYICEEIADACEMAEHMQKMRVFNTISDSSWDVTAVRLEEITEEEIENGKSI